MTRYDSNLALYDRLVATNPRIERKGKAMPYTSMNGNMFSFLTKEGNVALRLSADDRKAFMKKYRAKPCVQHGTVMKEYVQVPAGMLKKTAELERAFARSVAYASSLKPKATTRKKKATKKAATKKAAKKKAAPRKESAKKKARARKKAAKKKAASRKKRAKKRSASRKKRAKKRSAPRKKRGKKKAASRKKRAKKRAGRTAVKKRRR